MTGAPDPPISPPITQHDEEKLRAALDGYAAVDVGTILETLSPGAAANRRKAERVGVLVRLLADPAAARLALGNLTPLARRLLGVAGRTEQTSIAALLLAGQDREHDQDAVRQEVQGLVGRALLILEGPGTNGTKVSLDLEQPTAALLRAWVPRVVRDVLAVVDDELPPLRPLRGEPGIIAPGSFALLRRDLYLALRFLRTTGLRLTRSGEPHRADLRKLLTALQSGTTPSRRDGEVVIEGRLGFLLRLLDAAELTAVVDNQLRADDRIEGFLNSAELEAARLLYDAWLDLDWSEFRRLGHLSIEPWSYSGSGDLPDVVRLGAARRSLVALLAALPDGWVTVDALSERLRQTEPEFLIPRVPDYPPSYYSYYSYYGNDSYYGTRQALEQVYYRGFARADLRSRDRRLRKDQDWDEVEGAFIAQVLAEPLGWLGLIDLGYRDAAASADGEPPQAVRLTELGQRLIGGHDDVVPAPAASGVALVVQPNFEVLVLDALGHLELISRLDAFADAQSIDRAAIYKLSRLSVVRGLTAGWTLDRIVETLESASGTPLPQNVRHTIGDWSREYERVHLHRDTTIVEAPDAATLDGWLADPALGAALTRRLTPTIALLRAEAANDFAIVLDQRGEEVWSVNYALDPPQALDLKGPDTIVVAPEDDDPYLRYRLARFADWHEGGEWQGATYGISPASLARARESGQSIDEILAFLGYKARAGLSPDDVLTVRGWSGFYKPFQFARVRVVELPPTANWGDLSRVKALRPLILRILTTNLALIAEERWTQLETALRQRGIALHEGLNVQPQVEKRSAAQRAAVDLGLPTGRDLADGLVSGSRAARRDGLQALRGRQLVDFIIAALEADRALVFEYQKPNERRTTIRTVEPHELEVRGGAYYLHGFCRNRQGDRVFRLNGILGIAHAAE
jgi:hypothetical protein